MKLKKWLMCLAMIAFVVMGTDVVFAAGIACQYEGKIDGKNKKDTVTTITIQVNDSGINIQTNNRYEVLNKGVQSSDFKTSDGSYSCPTLWIDCSDGVGSHKKCNLREKKALFSGVDGQNGKEITVSENEQITCSYSGKNSKGNAVTSITVNASPIGISMITNNGYYIENKSVEVSHFQNADGTYFCPTLWIACDKAFHENTCYAYSSEQEIGGVDIIPGDQSSAGTETENTGTENIYETGDVIDTNCGMISDILPYIRDLYKMMMIVIPIALIIFGAIDFTTPLLSNDREALSKATSKFVKRCIVMVVIFLAPTIIQYILNVYSDTTGKDITMCGLIGTIIKILR